MSENEIAKLEQRLQTAMAEKNALVAVLTGKERAPDNVDVELFNQYKILCGDTTFQGARLLGDKEAAITALEHRLQLQDHLRVAQSSKNMGAGRRPKSASSRSSSVPSPFPSWSSLLRIWSQLSVSGWDQNTSPPSGAPLPSPLEIALEGQPLLKYLNGGMEHLQEDSSTLRKRVVEQKKFEVFCEYCDAPFTKEASLYRHKCLHCPRVPDDIRKKAVAKGSNGVKEEATKIDDLMQKQL